MMDKTYRVNDVFYSLQGEGHNTGRAAVFVRFSGCNLRCPFCDTDFSEFDNMTAEEIVSRMTNLIPKSEEKPMVVLTGGEPTLQADCALIDAIHNAGFQMVAMESNGTGEPPANLDWLTVSPKERVSVNRCNELKVLFDGKNEPSDHGVNADFHYLQPLDSGDEKENASILRSCVDYIAKHPQWRLSLQTHKLIGIK